MFQCEESSEGRAERVVHLLAVLPGARAHLRRHGLHDEHRRLVGRLRAGRVAARPAHLPWRVGCRPAGRDHQGDHLSCRLILDGFRCSLAVRPRIYYIADRSPYRTTPG